MSIIHGISRRDPLIGSIMAFPALGLMFTPSFLSV